MNTLFIGFSWLLHQQLINNNKKSNCLLFSLCLKPRSCRLCLCVCFSYSYPNPTVNNPKKKTKTVAVLFTFSAQSIQVVCFAAKLKPSANFVALHNCRCQLCIQRTLSRCNRYGFSFLLCCFFLCLRSICLFSSVWFRFRHFLPIDCVAVFLRPVFLLVPCVFSQLRAYPPVFISFTLVTKNYSPLPSENKPKIHSPPLLKPIELPAPVMTVLTHQSNPSHLHTLTHSRKKSIKGRRDVTQLSNC